jgi:hypothetical protein
MYLIKILLFAAALGVAPPNIPAEFFKRPIYMPYSFGGYKNPDFDSEPAGYYSPQFVSVLRIREDGWVLIHTNSGPQWANLKGDPGLRRISRVMGVYDNAGDETEVGFIKPQAVKVISRQENWELIETWLGEKWINLDSTPSVAALDDFIKQYNKSVSVYYENIRDGFVYKYNENKAYNAASVIKAPYCLYIYDLAEKGLADLSASHVYADEFYIGGRGIIQTMTAGAIFPENELLSLAIRESDNIAMKMLLDKYGVSGFKEFASGLGANADAIGKILYEEPTARMDLNEAALYMKAIYNYIEGDGAYAAQFKADLLNTTFGGIISEFPVANKYGGSSSLNAFHDAAIVYADSPYILIIMSNRSNMSVEDIRVFNDISMAVQNYNESYF